MALGQRVDGWSVSCGTCEPLNFEGGGATPAHKSSPGGTEALEPAEAPGASREPY